MHHEPEHPKPPASLGAITRAQLMRWLWPNCDHEHAAVMYPQSDGALSPGWVKGEEDVERAAKAFVDGTLACERFESVTKDGKSYSIRGATQLGFVPHRNSMVTVFCLDLDDHTDDGGNAHLVGSLSRFFGVSPVCFTSKGGKGFHCFFKLREPMAVRDFVAWSKAWGFNRLEEPEVFPKTEKLTQVWLPGEPNEQGGDRYISGGFDSCVINELPKAPPVQLTSTTLRYLRGQVSEPGRNIALNKVAHELGQKQINRSQAWILCERASRLCGLEPDETRTTFESGYKSGMQSEPQLPLNSTDQGAAENSANQYELDGIGNGERFSAMHARDARYCRELDTWFVWDTTRWLASSTRIEAMAKASARTIENYKYQRKSCGKQGINEMLFMARSEPSMSVRLDQFDGDPMLLNCQSGTVDLRTGVHRKHDRANLLRKISPIRYEEHEQCTIWLAFLDTVCCGDRELIGYIQRVCGYMLTGGVSEQCLFFIYGLGANGKSVFATLLLHLLGDYGVRTPAELVMKTHRTSAGSASPDVARLHGARLAVTSELDDEHKLGEARVKDITGGDRMVARPLYHMPFEFDPTHKLLLYGNHKPVISGTDQGIWRRIRLIPFAATIPETQRDPHLLDKLKCESGAILAWMVRGCLAWQRDGLGLAKSVAKATGSFRSESDVVGRFIDECCTLAEGVFVSKGDLYASYRAWCTLSGEQAQAKNLFGARIMQRGIKEKRSNTGRMWIGIELDKEIQSES